MIVRGWRISLREFADTMWSGIGASRTGARWNSKGIRVCYASSSLSLSVLETLVHLKKLVAFRQFVYAPVDMDDALIETVELSALPRGWDVEPPRSSMTFGDAWAQQRRSVVLRVPSAILPIEHNYVINPDHPNFSKLSRSDPQPFTFDPRLAS